MLAIALQVNKKTIYSLAFSLAAMELSGCGAGAGGGPATVFPAAPAPTATTYWEILASALARTVTYRF